MCLNETYENLELSAFRTAFSLIKKAERLAAFGIGDSYLSCVSFQNNMMKIRKNVLLSSLSGEQNQLAWTLTSDNCAVFVSWSGESEDLLVPLDILRKNSVPVILITSRKNSSMAKKADAVLELAGSESQTLKFETFSSQVSIQFTLNLLYLTFFLEDYETNKDLQLSAEAEFIEDRLL